MIEAIVTYLVVSKIINCFFIAVMVNAGAFELWSCSCPGHTSYGSIAQQTHWDGDSCRRRFLLRNRHHDAPLCQRHC